MTREIKKYGNCQRCQFKKVERTAITYLLLKSPYKATEIELCEECMISAREHWKQWLENMDVDGTSE